MENSCKIGRKSGFNFPRWRILIPRLNFCLKRLNSCWKTAHLIQLPGLSKYGLSHMDLMSMPSRGRNHDLNSNHRTTSFSPSNTDAANLIQGVFRKDLKGMRGKWLRKDRITSRSLGIRGQLSTSLPQAKCQPHLLLLRANADRHCFGTVESDTLSSGCHTNNMGTWRQLELYSEVPCGLHSTSSLTAAGYCGCRN